VDVKDVLRNLPGGSEQLQVTDSTTQQTHSLIENPKMMNDALVLDAKLRQSLVTMRSLGRRGLRVAGLEVSSNVETPSSVPAFSSRWCQRKFIAPAYNRKTEPYLMYLEQVLESIGPSVLIASSDSTLDVIRQNREQLERHVCIALAKDPALSIAINKDQTLEIAKHIGISIPRGMNVSSVNEVSQALREIGLPAVVKPIESWVWGEQQGTRLECRLVTTLDEARSAVEELTRSGGGTLFQQFLSGRREAISFLYAHGEIYARFAQWASRTQPPLGGTSTFRQSIAIPVDTGDQAERLVREIDLDGYSEVEFRRDKDGKPYLMEINPRLSASVEIAVRAGVDFPFLLYQWAKGDNIDHVKSYRVGSWMRYLKGDIQTTIQYLIERGRPGVTPPTKAIFDYFFSFSIPSGYDYFDWKDPLPAWVAMIDFGRYVRNWLKRSSRS
jgi:predicted ATP-grasp superfamily ATP-dependent carboligase